jgi:hypothetical protein
MPFTFSHPALILPLIRLPKRWVSATGLVVGSIIPDFEKFLKMNDGNTYSHTIPGMFWFDLPLGLLLSFVFHLIVRDPLIDNLPQFLRARFNPAIAFNWMAHFRQYYLTIICSLLLGTASHIVWDSFTHYQTRTERVMQVPAEKAANLEEYWLYYLLDLVSSLVGGIVVLRFILKLPSDKSFSGRFEEIQIFWSSVCITALTAILLRTALGPRLEHHYDLAIVVIAAGMAGLIVASALIRARSHRRPPGN